MYINVINGRVAQISETIIAPLPNWFEVDWTPAKPLYEQHGVAQYKYVDGVPVERTQTEIDAEVAAIPPPEPTPQEQTDALMLDHEERLIYLELGVTE